MTGSAKSDIMRKGLLSPGHTQHEEEARHQPGPEVDGDAVVGENCPGTVLNEARDPLHGITITGHQIKKKDLVKLILFVGFLTVTVKYSVYFYFLSSIDICLRGVAKCQLLTELRCLT